MANAQQYLNNNYPEEIRNSITELDLSGWNEKDWTAKPTWEKLTGDLDLSNFPNLEKLDCSKNLITSLNLANCPNLTELKCWENELTEINFPSSPLKLKTFYAWTNHLTEIDWKTFNPESLINVSISNNNLQTQSIEIFNQFPNLEELYVGNDNKERLEKKIKNRFIGSLKTLKDLDKLEKLQIEGTDIYFPKDTPKDTRVITWSRRTIIKQLKLTKEETEKLWRTNKNNFLEIFKEIIINHAKKQLGLNLTLDQEIWIGKLGKSIADVVDDINSESVDLENKLQVLNEYWEELLKKQEEDNKNRIIANVVPLERLFVIRSNIKHFLKKWGAIDKNNQTKLSKLKSPEEFSNYKYLSIPQWGSRAITVAGGILTLTGQPIIGGVMAAASPFVDVAATSMKENFYESKKEQWNGFLEDVDNFLDSYHELLGILKKIKKEKEGTINQALNILRKKVDGLLSDYDKDKNGEIEIEELINERHKFNRELGSIRKMMEAMTRVEDEVIKYQQGDSNEENIEEKGMEQQLENKLITEQQITSQTPYQKIKTGIKDWWTDLKTKMNIPIQCWDCWECCQKETKKNKGKTKENVSEPINNIQENQGENSKRISLAEKESSLQAHQEIPPK
ncbi:MAG: hypothetical protein MRERV_20c031 [Mycoplasmataceae bacterium RV_VA103A]|nr:MAG: hypothetical protein MRERV_20c031 [Mycoplasmataceae bacterium RV_VA103A]